MTNEFHITIDLDQPLDLDQPDHREVISVVLGKIQELCYQIADDSGWHEDDSRLTEKILLWHSEVSEAAEELRDGHGPEEIYYSHKAGNQEVATAFPTRETSQGGRTVRVRNKPEGVGAEAADVLVRVLDDSGRYKIPLVQMFLEKLIYNRTRPRRHGGKTF